MEIGQYTAVTAVWDEYDADEDILLTQFATQEKEAFIVSDTGLDDDPYDIGDFDETGLFSQIPKNSRANLSDLVDHLNNPLVNHLDEDSQLTPSNDRVLVLIHGWNPERVEKPLEVEQFGDLVNNLTQDNKLTNDWSLVLYDWSDDAATGTDLIPILPLAEKNLGMVPFGGEPSTISLLQLLLAGGALQFTAENFATTAAERALQHGIVLGKQLVDQIGINALKQVHLIAHSAGSWAAFAAMRYIRAQSPEVEVMVTYLDPFIPNEAAWYKNNPFLSHPFTSSVLESTLQYVGPPKTPGAMSAEAYYTSNDETEILALFGLISNAKTVVWDTWDRSNGGLVYRTGNLGLHPYDGHSGPIQFYADSIEPPGSSTFEGLAWNLSLASNTMIGLSDVFRGEPINGFPEWMASRWYKNYNVDLWPWIYHDEHGWQFVDSGSTEDVIYVWDLGLGDWIFFNEQAYRWLFRFGLNKGWIFPFADNKPGSRFFQRLDDGSIFSIPPGLLVE